MCLVLASCGGGGSSSSTAKTTTAPPTVTTNPTREAAFLAALAKDRGRIDAALSSPNAPTTDQVLISQAYAWCAALHAHQTTWKDLADRAAEQGQGANTEWTYDLKLVLKAAKAHLC
jgi:hypothetical protein